MSRDRRNIFVLAAGEGFWGLQTGLVYHATVLTMLLRDHYLASESMIGLLSAVTNGALVFPQILGIYIFRSRKRRKQQLILWHLVLMIPLLFVCGILILNDHLFSPVVVSWLLLLIIGLFFFNIGVLLSVWLDWLASLFSFDRRGTAMGFSFGVSALISAASALVAGRLIENYPGTTVYGWLYIFAGAVAIVSICTFLLIDDPNSSLPEHRDTPELSILLKKFVHSLTDRNFRMFLIGRLLATAGFCILPFIAVYYRSSKGGSLDGGLIVSCGAAQTFGVAVSNIFLGKLGDRHGHRLGLLIGIVFQVVALSLMLLSAGQFSCILAYFAAGVSISAAMTAHHNMVFETCPHDHRLAHITVGSLIMSIGIICFPLLAGLTAQLLGLSTLFIISTGISMIALLWFIFLVNEPRQILLDDGFS